MRLRTAASVTITVSCIVLAVAGTAARGAGPARAKVIIESWPKGLLGYLTSPKPARCAARRQLVVYEQRGPRPDPASDPRIARVRTAGKPGAYEWWIKTKRRGRFYAQVVDKQGCPIATSTTIRIHVGSGFAGGGTSYPPCSPYVSEGPTTICHFELLHLVLENPSGAFKACVFGDANGSCKGVSRSGLYPWGAGAGGGGTKVNIEWHGAGARSVLFVAYYPDSNVGIAHLSGTVPAANSPDFTVTEGFAANDSGYPNGNHFYTPDIPGQTSGEVGGPLHINFINGSFSSDAEVYIDGYLYLKQ